MQTTRIHGWERGATYVATRSGSLRAIVVCRYCGLMASATLGSSPLRPGPCPGDRPPPAPTVWAARRPEATARYWWALRAR